MPFLMNPSSRSCGGERLGIVVRRQPQQATQRRGQPALGQPGDGPEVEHAQPAGRAVGVGQQPEVPRVRVGVQHAGAGGSGEQEAHQQLAVVVAFLAGAVGDHRRQRRGAVHPLGDEHGGARGHDTGHHDARVVGEGVGERLLGLGLQLVVELVGGALLQLAHERQDVDAGEDGGDAAGHQGELPEVAEQGVARPGVLHLDRDLATVVPPTAVDLADRGRRGRTAVEADQPVPPVGTEVGLDLVAHRLGRHRRRGVLQGGQVRAVRRGHVVGEGRLEDRERLAELHRAALELAQGAEQLLGGALLHLDHHGLGRLPAQALAEPQRAATGVPQRQGGEARGARHGLAGQVGHGASVPGERRTGVGRLVKAGPAHPVPDYWARGCGLKRRTSWGQPQASAILPAQTLAASSSGTSTTANPPRNSLVST